MTDKNFFDNPEMTKYVMQEYGYTKNRAQKIVIQLNKLNFFTKSNMTVDELFNSFDKVKV